MQSDRERENRERDLAPDTSPPKWLLLETKTPLRSPSWMAGVGHLLLLSQVHQKQNSHIIVESNSLTCYTTMPIPML